VELLNECYLCHTKEDLAVLAGDVDAAPDDIIRLIPSSDHWSRDQWQWLVQRYAPRLISLVRRREIEADHVLRVFGRHGADMVSWPDEQRRTTEDALGEVLVEALEQWSTDELVDLLDVLAYVYEDLGPWLARVDAATRPAARGGVVRLAFLWAFDLTCGWDEWFGWWRPDDPATPVREWLRTARPGVEQFGREHPTCKNARDTLIAIDSLDGGEGRPWLSRGDRRDLLA
jgi:hypothetical protein